MDGGRGCTTVFVECGMCKQVLIPDDFSHHKDSHDQTLPTAADFPHLPRK